MVNREDEKNRTSTDGFIGQFEIDAAGVPFYRWPPWPSPPPCASIMPFTAFVPVGIRIRPNELGREVDGLGIPTVTIPVRHPRDSGGGEQNANKKKRKGATGDGTVPTWDQLWAEVDRGAPVRVYNPREDRRDRLVQAVSDFQSGRQWTPHLQSIFDSFRHFIGMATNPNNTDAVMKDTDDVSLSGSESDISESALEGAVYMREAMMNRFLNDPELAVKIYLSSYFSRMGLLWVYGKLLSAPLFVRFFLHFLLKNDVFPESKRDLDRALAATDRARVELPATWHASQALARDMFGRLCADALRTTCAVEDDGWQIDRGTKTLHDYLPDARFSLERAEVEVSCRRVVRVHADAALGSIVLAPWGGPFSRDIPRPHAASNSVSIADEITVFVDPEVPRDILVGLGIHGTWVRVEPQSDAEAGRPGWWYIESVTGTFPSYWESDQLEG